MNVRPVAAAAALLLAVGGLAACGSSTGGSSSASPTATAAESAAALTVADPWVKATDTEMTGAFGMLRNPGSADVTVVSATTSASTKTELHETVMKDGAMVMQPKEGGFVVPAGGELALEPGGNHIMIMALASPIAPGDEVSITLTLDSGATIEYPAVAKEFTGANESYQPAPESEGMDMSSESSS